MVNQKEREASGLPQAEGDGGEDAVFFEDRLWFWGQIWEQN